MGSVVKFAEGSTAEAAKPVRVVAPDEKPLRPGQCRAYLRKAVAAAFRDIAHGFIQQATTGSCQHVKMAADVVSSKKPNGAESRVKGPAEQLMDELGLE